MKGYGIVTIVFIVGCVTGGVAAQLVVPPVRAGTSPTRWEYQCVTVGGKRATVTPTLNQLGAEGWELASLTPAGATSAVFGYDVDSYTLCAKRALP